MNSNKCDDDDEDDRCPICYDTFNFPKLLACRHTFCQSCLEQYHDLSEEPRKREAIRCPQCRILSVLPKGGIPELNTNFFVIDKIIKSLNRNTYHETEDGSGGENSDKNSSSDNDDDNETESRDENCEDVVPFPAHCFLQSKPHTKYMAKLSLKYICETEERGRNCVTSICPTRANECYIVKYSSSSVFKLDGHRTVKRYTLMSPAGILRVVERHDGSMLALHPHNVSTMTSGFCSKCFSYHVTGELAFVLVTSVVFTDMDVFPDGKIVVIGHNLGVKNAGVVIFFSETGTRQNILGKPGKYRNAFEFEAVFNPKSVAVNPKNNFVYICDIASRCIYTILQSGQHISTFGKEWCSFASSRSILPMCICCDTEGNIMFIDRETNSIYVLNSLTGRVGIIITTQTSGLGDPNVVACCKNGSIIIGDRFNGNVNKYRITEYDNVF